MATKKTAGNRNFGDIMIRKQTCGALKYFKKPSKVAKPYVRVDRSFKVPNKCKLPKFQISFSGCKMGRR